MSRFRAFALRSLRLALYALPYMGMAGVAYAQGGTTGSSASTPASPSTSGGTIPALPTGWGAPIDLSSSPIAQAIFAILQYLLPIIGAIIIARVVWEAVTALHYGAAGRQERIKTGHIVQVGFGSSVMQRLIELGVAVLMLALFFSGLWVEVLNTVFTLAIKIIDAVLHAMSGIPVGGSTPAQ